MALVSALANICSTTHSCRADVLESVLDLACDIAREGHEGRHVGALFTIGRADDVLKRSRPLILDPLLGHRPHATRITNSDLRGTIKALAQLDGAFVISEEGSVTGACRYLDSPSEGVELPMGLGSRHLAAAAVSRHLRIVSIVVSESGIVRVFFDGRLVSEAPAT